jgi:actin related protein 2/3 complex subunit 2
MIQLEVENVIIRELLQEKFIKPSSVDQQFVDFDGVRYHLHTPERKTELLLSMDIRCWPDLVLYWSCTTLGGLIAVARRRFNTAPKR